MGAEIPSQMMSTKGAPSKSFPYGRGYAGFGFGPCFHLPGFHFGTVFCFAPQPIYLPFSSLRARTEAGSELHLRAAAVASADREGVLAPVEPPGAANAVTGLPSAQSAGQVLSGPNRLDLTFGFSMLASAVQVPKGKPETNQGLIGQVREHDP